MTNVAVTQPLINRVKYGLPIFTLCLPETPRHCPMPALCCHPQTRPMAPLAVHADAVWRPDGGLRFCYRIDAAVDSLHLPAPTRPGPQDGLWQTTCCEAFIAAVDRPFYQEFNFSPSGAWAHYHFADYRARQAHATDDRRTLASPATLQISCQTSADGFLLQADVDRSLLPDSPQFDIALTAVIEQGGSKTYWALHHAGPQADFHLRPSFTLRLNRP